MSTLTHYTIGLVLAVSFLFATNGRADIVKNFPKNDVAFSFTLAAEWREKIAVAAMSAEFGGTDVDLPPPTGYWEYVPYVVQQNPGEENMYVSPYYAGLSIIGGETTIADLFDGVYGFSITRHGAGGNSVIDGSIFDTMLIDWKAQGDLWRMLPSSDPNSDTLYFEFSDATQLYQYWEEWDWGYFEMYMPFHLGTFIGDDRYTFKFYAPSTDAVPEPATIALLGFGLAGLGLARRRRS